MFATPTFLPHLDMYVKLAFMLVAVALAAFIGLLYLGCSGKPWRRKAAQEVMRILLKMFGR